MRQVVLVDDDIEVLTMLSHLIDWEAHGYHIRATCENGEEVYEQVPAAEIDLLIADIGMPGMDGFTLVRLLKEQNPELRVIFLTCYEEFDYAKEALHLSADEYLLKYALTKNKLLSVLEEVDTILDEKNKEKEKLRRYSDELMENRDVFKQRFFHTVCERGAEAALLTFGERLELYRVKLPEGAFRVGAVFLDEGLAADGTIFEVDESVRWQVVQNISAELEKGDCYVFPVEDYLIFLYENPLWTSGLPQNFLMQLQQLQRGVETTYGICATVCIGALCPSFAAVAEAAAAVEALRDQYFYGDAGKIISQTEAFTPISYQELLPRYASHFHLLQKDREKFPAAFAALCAEISTARYEPRAVRRVFADFIDELEKKAEAPAAADHFSRGPLFYGRFATYCSEIQTLFLNSKSGQSQDSAAAGNEDINKVMHYVQENLNQPIILQSAADIIGKNSSYLSRLFKQSTGLNFSKYLTQKRIALASELLQETELPMPEVAQRIGIDNIYYFYRFYKKESGETPGSVRRKSSTGQ